MRLKHRIGQAGAMLGSIVMASALVYWINGMFLSGGVFAVYNALTYGVIGLVLIVGFGSFVESDTA